MAAGPVGLLITSDKVWNNNTLVPRGQELQEKVPINLQGRETAQDSRFRQFSYSGRFKRDI